MEDWLGKEQLSMEEVENAKKYFPLYSNKFVETIQRKEGKGSKLAKIHLLHHFVDNIINFGHADNVFGGIGEYNMKPNVKDPARRTRYQDDQEFNILFKQYENIYFMLVKLNLRLEVHLKKLMLILLMMENTTQG